MVLLQVPPIYLLFYIYTEDKDLNYAKINVQCYTRGGVGGGGLTTEQATLLTTTSDAVTTLQLQSTSTSAAVVVVQQQRVATAAADVLYERLRSQQVTANANDVESTILQNTIANGRSSGSDIYKIGETTIDNNKTTIDGTTNDTNYITWASVHTTSDITYLTTAGNVSELEFETQPIVANTLVKYNRHKGDVIVGLTDDALYYVLDGNSDTTLRLAATKGGPNLITGVVASVTITNRGTYSSVPTIVFSDPTSSLGMIISVSSNVLLSWESDQTHAAFTATSTTGAGVDATVSVVTNSSGTPTFTLVAGGTGYAVGDTLIFTDPGNTTNTTTITVESIRGVRAQGTVVLDADGGVDEIIMTHHGSGYTDSPTMTFSDGDATGTVVTTCVTNSVSHVLITDGGEYGFTPSVVFTAPSVAGGVTAVGTAIMMLNDAGKKVVSSVVLNDAGTGYLEPPTVTFASGGVVQVGAASAHLTTGVFGHNIMVDNIDWVTSAGVSDTSNVDRFKVHTTGRYKVRVDIAFESGALTTEHHLIVRLGSNNYARPIVYEQYALLDSGMTSGTLSLTKTCTLLAHYINEDDYYFILQSACSVSSVTITTGGGYTSVPTVTFDLPAPTTRLRAIGGRRATGTAVLDSSGQVVSVTINDEGRGYTSAPGITFSTEGETTAAVAVGVLSSVSMMTDDIYANEFSIDGPIQILPNPDPDPIIILSSVPEVTAACGTLYQYTVTAIHVNNLDITMAVAQYPTTSPFPADQHGVAFTNFHPWLTLTRVGDSSSGGVREVKYLFEGTPTNTQDVDMKVSLYDANGVQVFQEFVIAIPGVAPTITGTPNPGGGGTPFDVKAGILYDYEFSTMMCPPTHGALDSLVIKIDDVIVFNGTTGGVEGAMAVTDENFDATSGNLSANWHIWGSSTAIPVAGNVVSGQLDTSVNTLDACYDVSALGFQYDATNSTNTDFKMSVELYGGATTLYGTFMIEGVHEGTTSQRCMKMAHAPGITAITLDKDQFGLVTFKTDLNGRFFIYGTGDTITVTRVSDNETKTANVTDPASWGGSSSGIVGLGSLNFYGGVVVDAIRVYTNPSWLRYTYTGSAHKLSVTPSVSRIGTGYDVDIVVTDGTQTTTQSFTANVIAANWTAPDPSTVTTATWLPNNPSLSYTPSTVPTITDENFLIMDHDLQQNSGVTGSWQNLAVIEFDIADEFVIHLKYSSDYPDWVYSPENGYSNGVTPYWHFQIIIHTSPDDNAINNNTYGTAHMFKGWYYDGHTLTQICNDGVAGSYFYISQPPSKLLHLNITNFRYENSKLRYNLNIDGIDKNDQASTVNGGSAFTQGDEILFSDAAPVNGKIYVTYRSYTWYEPFDYGKHYIKVTGE